MAVAESHADHTAIIIIGGFLYNAHRFVNTSWIAYSNKTNLFKAQPSVAARSFTPRGGAAIVSVWSSTLNTTLIWLMGGHRFDDQEYQYNDVYVSSDLAKNWHLLTAQAAWADRSDAAAAVTADGIMVLIGGQSHELHRAKDMIYYNDVYVSFNGGRLWFELTSHSAFSGRSHVSITFDSTLHLLVTGGQRMVRTLPKAVNDLRVYRSKQSFNISTILHWIVKAHPNVTVPMIVGNNTVPDEPVFGLHCYEWKMAQKVTQKIFVNDSRATKPLPGYCPHVKEVAIGKKEETITAPSKSLLSRRLTSIIHAVSATPTSSPSLSLPTASDDHDVSAFGREIVQLIDDWIIRLRLCRQLNAPLPLLDFNTTMTNPSGLSADQINVTNVDMDTHLLTFQISPPINASSISPTLAVHYLFMAIRHGAHRLHDHTTRHQSRYTILTAASQLRDGNAALLHKWYGGNGVEPMINPHTDVHHTMYQSNFYAPSPTYCPQYSSQVKPPQPLPKPATSQPIQVDNNDMIFLCGDGRD